ncbi:MAG: aminoglycoside adenylyltransferase domain-containing protein [Patescibacteria group bacterium]
MTKYNSHMVVPEDLNDFLETIKTELPGLLGNVLFGIYVYGSLSYSDFEEHRSDVDVMAVIKRELNEKELAKLETWYDSSPMRQSRWISRLEMDYTVIGKLISSTKHGAKTTHFAGGKLNKKADSDGSNPIVWINIKECGITLFGPSPKEFVPEISTALLLSALRSEFEDIEIHAPVWMKKDLWNQVYIVITLCRIAYTLKKNKLVSKKEAGKWCLENLPKRFRPMVAIVLQKVDNFMGPLEPAITNGLPVFIAYVDKLFLDKRQHSRNPRS